MKNKLYKILLVLIAMMSIILVGCKNSEIQGNDLKEISEKGYFVLGFDDTFVPMGFKDTKGEIVGFDIDLANEVSTRMGLDIKLQPIDWSMKESELNSGNVDVLWNGYSITEKRKEKLAFTNPYLKNSQVIITLKDSPINTKNDLKNKRLGAQNESSSVEAINKEPEFVEELKNGEIILFETNNDALMDLEAGRLDAIVADEILARYYIANRGEENYKILNEDFGKEEYGVGVRKSSKEFLNELNKTLDDIKNDGTAEKISEKWFKENIIN